MRPSRCTRLNPARHLPTLGVYWVRGGTAPGRLISSAGTCPGTFPRVEDTARADLSAQRGGGYGGTGHLDHKGQDRAAPVGSENFSAPDPRWTRRSLSLPLRAPLRTPRLRSHAFSEPHLESLDAPAARSEH